MLRYAITNRALFPGDESAKQADVLRHAFHWVRDGFDFIQLREKDLSGDALAALASEILETISATTRPTRLLVNSRADVAVATRAHGVHLSAAPDAVTPDEVRGLYASAKLPAPIVSVSCHTLFEVERARANLADLILFAPVFEKSLGSGQNLQGQGPDRLREACATALPIPVLALGGVTFQNAAVCLAAGAAGIAGIRLFHGG
jgi:thiamine-phosphate pyrophosphorylase